MQENTKDRIKEIKQSFRLYMNGVAAQSMREKGISYKVNWGIQLPTLQRMASLYGKDYELATELWKENIRECKIMAAIIMPPEKMLPDMAQLWMEQIDNQELAELLPFLLFHKLPYIIELAYRWMSSENKYYQIAAFNTLARVFTQTTQLGARDINEFLDQTMTSLSSEDVTLRHSARNALCKFMLIGDDYEQIARKALKTCDLVFL